MGSIKRILATLGITLAFMATVHSFALSAETSQIKSGVVFLVPLTDGTTAPARCEIVSGKARLTYISDGKFIDLQIVPWNVTPDPIDPVDPVDPVVVNPYQPSPEYKNNCLPLTKFKFTRADADMVSAFYAGMGLEVSKADSSLITSNQLRAVLLVQGQSLCIKGKYAGLREAMEKVLIDTLTLKSWKLDKARTNALLQTIAWAIYEAGGSK